MEMENIENYEEHEISYEHKLILLKNYIIDKTRDLKINCLYEHFCHNEMDILKIIIIK